MGGTNYNNLRHAYDTALLAGNEKELSDLKMLIQYDLPTKKTPNNIHEWSA